MEKRTWKQDINFRGKIKVLLIFQSQENFSTKLYLYLHFPLENSITKIMIQDGPLPPPLLPLAPPPMSPEDHHRRSMTHQQRLDNNTCPEEASSSTSQQQLQGRQNH